MRRMLNFLRLPFREKSLLLKSAFLLSAVRLGLTLFSFKTLQGLLEGVRQRRSNGGNADLPLDRIAWAVETGGRYVPRTTCLSKALTAQALFIRNGYQSNLHIGVLRNKVGKLEAHAWVTIHGQVVIGGGGRDLSKYASLVGGERLEGKG